MSHSPMQSAKRIEMNPKCLIQREIVKKKFGGESVFGNGGGSATNS